MSPNPQPSVDTTAPTPPGTRKAMHVFGSTKDEYYSAISVYYAKEAAEASWMPKTYINQFACVSPDLMWRFPQSPNKADVEAAKPHTLSEAMDYIRDVLQPDVMIPHMYCPPGMTTYRALFEQCLNVPVVGCDPDCMSLTTDKFQSQAVCQAYGVTIPVTALVEKADDPRLPSVTLPAIVKPCCEDNSIGLALVHSTEELYKAVEHALTTDTRVVVQQYIPPGREIRVGLVELPDGTLQTLPKYEYFVSPEDPIRTMAHKYTDKDDQGELKLATSQRKCPADVDPELDAELDRQAKLAHKALKHRDYSLFDFRVDPQGKVYFLEACPYVSFTPGCPLMVMTDRTDLKCPVFWELCVDEALKRKAKAAKAQPH
mmetsp:Transcript_65309/g.108465  ORF Transcript_65309/g.108465 Transcript_65309/m.108465 type:complete len:372 (+) Transcript_65309:118-1233(+)